MQDQVTIQNANTPTKKISTSPKPLSDRPTHFHTLSITLLWSECFVPRGCPCKYSSPITPHTQESVTQIQQEKNRPLIWMPWGQTRTLNKNERHIWVWLHRLYNLNTPRSREWVSAFTRRMYLLVMTSKMTCGEVVKAFTCKLKSPDSIPTYCFQFFLPLLTFKIWSLGLGGKSNNTLTFKTTREDQ